VEQASSSVIITDLEGTIEYVNPYFCKTTGYSYAEIAGENPRILKSGAQDDSIYREMWETITSGKTWKGVFINKIKDGSLIHEEANIFPVRDSSGKIIKFASVKSNITDRLRQRKDQEAEHLFQYYHRIIQQSFLRYRRQYLFNSHS
jgi:PAS domain S-box-containing protein